MQALLALENFLTYLRLHKGRSMRTLEQYEFHIWRLLSYLDPRLTKEEINHREIYLDLTPEKRMENRMIRIELMKKYPFEVEQITKEDINAFRLDLSKDNLSVKSINAHIITYRSWLKYLKKEQIASLDPTVLDLMKPPDREVTFLINEEIVRFFDIIGRTTIREKRDYAICQCIYSTGLRISELTALDIQDVNLTTLEFAVRGKWGKIRVVYLTELARDAIREYLTARQDRFSPLFIRHNFSEENIDSIDLSDKKVRLTRFFITGMVKEYGLKAGILKNLHAHTLRHSFATTLLTNGADIRIIQELLGHASITTTQVYTHVTNPKLKEAHQKFHK
jgi:integrase/recombinase XerD